MEDKQEEITLNVTVDKEDYRILEGIYKEIFKKDFEEKKKATVTRTNVESVAAMFIQKYAIILLLKLINFNNGEEYDYDNET